MEFAVLLDSFVPWQDVVEVLWMPLDVSIRQMFEDVSEVLERVQAVGLGRLDDAVDGGAGFGSFRGVAEQPVLAADGEVADGALGRPDDPVGQRCTRERDANLFPLPFLSVERHGLLVLLHHDMRDA